MPDCKTRLSKLLEIPVCKNMKEKSRIPDCKIVKTSRDIGFGEMNENYLAEIIGGGVGEAGVAEAGAAAWTKSFVTRS